MDEIKHRVMSYIKLYYYFYFPFPSAEHDTIYTAQKSRK
jgi:hypothetical protein